MVVAIPKETRAGETRIPLIPAAAKKLVDLRAEVRIESGLGAGCRYADQAYVDSGASVSASRERLLGEADVVLRLNKPPAADVSALKEGCIHLSYLDPFNERELVELLDRASDGLEQVFYILLGSVIGGYSGGCFAEIVPLAPVALCLLAVRGIARTAGAAVRQYIAGTRWNLWGLYYSGWRPMGTLAAGLAVQLLYLPADLTHNTLIAGALLALFVSQLLPVPAATGTASQMRPNPTQD